MNFGCCFFLWRQVYLWRPWPFLWKDGPLMAQQNPNLVFLFGFDSGSGYHEVTRTKPMNHCKPYSSSSNPQPSAIETIWMFFSTVSPPTKNKKHLNIRPFIRRFKKKRKEIEIEKYGDVFEWRMRVNEFFINFERVFMLWPVNDTYWIFKIHSAEISTLTATSNHRAAAHSEKRNTFDEKKNLLQKNCCA